MSHKSNYTNLKSICIQHLFETQKESASASHASKHYRSMKAFTQKTIRKAYWQYFEAIVCSDTNEKENPSTGKKFWKFIKYQRQDPQGVAPLKKEGKLVDDSVGKANILNKQSSQCSPLETLHHLSSFAPKPATF